MMGGEGSGKRSKPEDAALLREIRELQERERKAHSISDDELAKKLAERARELKHKREGRS